jgi:inosine-uridine nucleoside N-ribohydrolase
MKIRNRNEKYRHNEFKYVIIDTDGGGDDCQALIALDYFIKKTGKVLLGISCTSGNTSVDDVVRNVLITQKICGSSYPVYVGNNFSLFGDSLKDYFFGEDGLGENQSYYLDKLQISKDYSTNGLVQKEKAYKFIVDSAIKYRNELAIILIGPFTNMALAYHYNNDIVSCFSNIMTFSCSGSLAGVHTCFTAEFNIAVDPEAAYCVF